MMDLYEKFARTMTRRAFLGRASTGIGSMALASLLHPAGARADDAGVRTLHRPAKAKRVIWLGMAGGPSHLETFDYKPKLGEMAGRPMPQSFTKGQPIAQLQGQQLRCFAPQYNFKRFGTNGALICELFPQIGSVVDDICIIRSMTTDA